MTRYQVYGYYTDEPQVVIDVVDAETSDEAERKVLAARSAENCGYTSDGAEPIEQAIKNLQEIMAKPASQIAADLAEIAAEYADEETDHDQ